MIPKSDNTPPTIPPPIEPAKVLKKEEKKSLKYNMSNKRKDTARQFTMVLLCSKKFNTSFARHW